ncbi:MAG: DUF2961 domain-containing protein [Chitinophagales bacterium]|nr:DUF2961 domain-containing protein [Chitinophagales bacterium]
MKRILLLCYCFPFFAFSQTLMDNAPKFLHNYIYYNQTSYDRNMGNQDGVPDSYFLDTIPSGLVNNPNGTPTGGVEYVVSHIKGPSVLFRWGFGLSTLSHEARLKFYFDGETVPRISNTLNEIFNIQQGIFQPPLLLNLAQSSGAMASFIPFFINKDLIITSNAGGFYQFNYKKFSTDTSVTTWQPNVTDSVLINEFNNKGNYPKSNLASLQTVQNQTTIASGTTQTIANLSGAKSIEQFKLSINELDFSYAERKVFSGQQFAGTSAFNMKVNGQANNVQLILTCNKNWELANIVTKPTFFRLAVYVDNIFVGLWTVYTDRDYHFWSDEVFTIPKFYYNNKSNIRIKLQKFGTDGKNPNEYYYKLKCDNIITDSLAVLDAASEASHNKVTTAIVPAIPQTQSERYITPENIKLFNKDILKNTFIKITFDNASQAQVYAPLGLFFGTGFNDAAYMQSLPCGNIGKEYYNYFSMPFWNNAKVELINNSNSNITVSYNVGTANNNSSKKETGYFTTQLNSAVKAANDITSYLICATQGKGKYVGTILEAHQEDMTKFAWMEGDDRVYIDDIATPLIHGTGTEDYFNGGFYFYTGEVDFAQSGMCNADNNYYRAMYRYHLYDPIYFRKNFQFWFEKGKSNEKQTTYNSLALFYLQPNDSTYFLSDELNVGNTTSETAHQYTNTNNKIYINKNQRYEGEAFNTYLSKDGYLSQDSVSFVATILPNNEGVQLQRTMDYTYRNQEAALYVDGVYLGNWLTAGSNGFNVWRDDVFFIPKTYTAGKSSITIKLVKSNNCQYWTATDYKVYTLLTENIVSTAINQNKLDNKFSIYPNPTSNILYLNTAYMYDNQPTHYTLFNQNGQLVKQEKLLGTLFNYTIDVNDLASGQYHLVLQQQNKIVGSKKITVIK